MRLRRSWFGRVSRREAPLKIAIRRPSAPTPGSSPPVPGRRLPSHRPRSTIPLRGWSAIAFGGPFLGSGLGIVIPALLGTMLMSSGVPQWIGVLCGSMFVLAGLVMFVPGVRDLRQERRVRRLRPHYEREPWVWDHPWNEQSSGDDSVRAIRGMLMFTGFLAMFAVVANWVGFLSPDRPVPFMIAAVILDLILTGVLWRTVYLVAQRAKYGVASIVFRRFPFIVGGEVEVTLVPTRALTQLTALEATLRCLQERYETTRDSQGRRSTKVVSYEVWASGPVRADVRRGESTWRFALPIDVPGTALSSRPPRYWELEVKEEAPGIDYAGVFLVPVYENERMGVRRAG